MAVRQNGGNGNGTNTGGGGGAGTGNSLFNSNRPITRNIPGWQGLNIGGTTVQDVLESLYPAVPPIDNFSVDRQIREIGENPAYTLSWSVTKNTNPITAIIVDGATITPTGASQSGIKAGVFPNAFGSYTLNMSVSDGTYNVPASCSVNYLYPIFYGTTVKDGTVGNPILDSDVLGLTKELRSDRLKVFTNYGGGNTRIILAIPSTFGTPQFKINGLNNTAFTKVRANSAFTNSQGATFNIDVWVSDNLYNSPLDSFQIL